MLTTRLTSLLLLCVLSASAWAITIEEIDETRNGEIDLLIVESEQYRITFNLNEIGSATQVIYKPLDHDFRAEQYYGNRVSFLRDWVRLSEPDPVTGLTPRAREANRSRNWPVSYRVVRQSDQELVLAFDVVVPDEFLLVPWMAGIRNERRITLRQDTPVIAVQNILHNDDVEDRVVSFELDSGIGLGRVLTAASFMTPEGKAIGRDVAEETGTGFLYGPHVTQGWLGGVNEQGLGAAFSFDVADVDGMQVILFKTVGSNYITGMRRRVIPAGESISFSYTFMPFTGFGALDGMQGDLAGGMLVGREADMFNQVARSEAQPDATLPVRVFLASGHNRAAQVHLHAQRREDGAVVLDQTLPITLATAQTVVLETSLTLGEAGLYVLDVTVTGDDGQTLPMQMPIVAGRSRLVYSATEPAIARRGERDLGETVGPAPMDMQFRTLDRDHVTAHLPLLANHVMGPVRVWFATPADTSLGHVREIVQRGDFDYGYTAIGQADPRSLNSRDVGQFMRDFRASDSQAVVTLAVHWHNDLQLHEAQELLGRVEEGLGLVLMAQDPQKVPVLRDALEQAQQVDSDSVLSILGVQAPTITLYEYGEGRIVVIDAPFRFWRDSAGNVVRGWDRLRVGQRGEHAGSLRWRGFEYSYAWLGEVIRWAARRESPLRITAIELENDAVVVNLHHDGQRIQAMLALTVRTRRWQVLLRTTLPITLEAGATQVHMPLATVLTQGPLMLEVQVRTEADQVLAFATAATANDRGTTLAVTPSPAFVQQSDLKPMRVNVTGPQGPATLDIEVTDRFGRLVHQETHTLEDASVRQNITVALDTITPLAIHHEVVARLRSGQQVIAQAWADLMLLPDNPDFEDRFVLGIADSPENTPLYIQGVLPTARAAGFTMHTHSQRGALPLLYATGGTTGGYNFIEPTKSRYASNRREARIDGPARIMYPALLPTEDEVTQMRERWMQSTTNLREQGVFYVGLDDERRMSDDFDFNPHTLAGLQAWLADHYGDIDTLNRAWDSDFASFDDVMPMTREQIEARDNIAPWLVFRRYIGHVLGEYYMKLPAQWAAEVDPRLAVGELGIYTPGPNWPVDWSEYARYYRHTGRYDSNIGALMRSFGQGARAGRWQGYGMRKIAPGRRAQLWRSLLEGGNFAWFWALVDNGRWNYGLNTSDQRMTEGYATLAAEEIPDLTGGIDRLFIASQFTFDPVAIGYSHPSILVNPSAAAAVSRQILEQLGLQPRYVRMADVATGRLQRDGYQAIVLQNTLALDDDEIDGLRQFAEDGGVVIVIGQAGRYNADGTPYPGPRPLDVLLGIDATQAQSLGTPQVVQVNQTPMRLTVALTDVKATDGEMVGTFDFENQQMVAVTRRKLGDGELWWINSTLGGHAATFTGGVAGEMQVTLDGPQAIRLAHWQLLRQILDQTSLEPRATLLDDGQPLYDTRNYIYESPSGRSIFLGRYLMREVDKPLDYQLVYGGHVYDLRAHRYLGHIVPGGSFTAQFPPGRVNIFAILDYQVTGLTLSLNQPTARPGDTLTASVQVLTEPADPGADLHALRVNLLDPDGNTLEAHRTVLLAHNGQATFTIPLALNAQPGTYTLEVFDVTSGQQVSETFGVQAQP